MPTEPVMDRGLRRIIGVELRLREGSGWTTEELALLPCDIVVPGPRPSEEGAELSLTVHTSHGDVSATINLDRGYVRPGA